MCKCANVPICNWTVKIYSKRSSVIGHPSSVDRPRPMELVLSFHEI